MRLCRYGYYFVWLIADVLLCAMCNSLTAQSPDLNYQTFYDALAPVNFVRTWSVSKPLMQPQDIINSTSTRDAVMTTQYLDGLGRHLQTVVKKGSLNSALGSTAAVDMVSASAYDEFGREAYKYLPFPATSYGGSGSINDGGFKYNPFPQLLTFYSPGNADNPLIRDDQKNYSYSKTVFEPSPLNRPLQTFAPGSSWAGSEYQPVKRSVNMGYYINTATDAVRIWEVNNSGTLGNYGAYENTGIYAAGLLYKNITTDEHNKQVIEFKDKEGLVLLKKVQLTAAADNGTGSGHAGWMCTYYLYDDFNSLRAVIQPVGVEELNKITGEWILTTTLYNEQCFRYEYDTRRRMIRKKVPGAAVVYMVYDVRDRLVLTQDGNMRALGKWMYNWYDELNRPVATGLWTTGTTGNNSLWTTHYDAAYTSSNSYPAASSSGLEELTLSFYDDYTWLTNATYSDHNLPPAISTTDNAYLLTASNINWPYPQPVTAEARVKGMMTGSRTKVLDSDPVMYLYTSIYYDEYNRPVQVQTRNITGETDIITTQYSFAGQPLLIINRQVISGTGAPTTVVVTSFTYDDLGRLAKTEKKIQNTLVDNNALSAPKTVNQIKYDALGQTKIKSVGQKRDANGNFTANPIESLTYDYNIRGWLLGVNSFTWVYLIPSQGQPTGLVFSLIMTGLVSILNTMAIQAQLDGEVWAME